MQTIQLDGQSYGLGPYVSSEPETFPMVYPRVSASASALALPSPSASSLPSSFAHQYVPLYQFVNDDFPADRPPAYQPQLPRLTQAIHNQTLKLLDEASKVSTSILHGTVTQVSPQAQAHGPAAAPVAPQPQTHNYFDLRTFSMFNSETHVHPDKSSPKEKDDTGTRVFVGIVGLIFAGIAAFGLGKALAEGEDIEEEKISYEQLKHRWTVNKDSYGIDYQMAADGVIQRTDSILDRRAANRTYNIALVAFSFIGGAVAVGGALAGSNALMLTAAAVGACVTVLFLFKLGYNCFSTRDEKDARAIEIGLQNLRYIQLNPGINNFIVG